MKALRPHRHVMLLAVVLMALMTTTIAFGTTGTLILRDDFENYAGADVPRLTDLLHLDRDLFRSERALEMSLLEPDSAKRVDLIDEFQNQLDRTTRWWNSYSANSVGQTDEIAWQSEYVDQRLAWLEFAVPLSTLALDDAQPTDPAVVALLTSTQDAFAHMRATVDNLEEKVGEPQIESSSAAIRRVSNLIVAAMIALMAVGSISGSAASIVTYRSARKQYRQGRAREIEREADAEKSAFEAELNQTLDMAQTEACGFKSMELILKAVVASGPTEFLLADSSQAHLRQVLTTDAESQGPGCPVLVPGDCPAIRRGTTLIFPEGDAYSSCPNLRDRGGNACSAICVPVSVAGRTVGVLHTTGDNGESPEAVMVDRLREVADRSGDRIGVLRAFAQSEAQASTDPLTGLSNRRSFENQTSQLLKSNHNLAIAYCDLDHFKDLNDTYGHDAGDRALRLFSKIVRDSLRDGDLAGRWGGEEFVIMFDNADASTAAAGLERIRQHLSVAVSGGTTPPFTASFGVADTTMSTDLEELVGTADEALLHAKRTGRDRVVISGLFDPTSKDVDETAEVHVGEESASSPDPSLA